MLKSFSIVADTYELDRASKGINLKNIPIAATIRIDVENDNDSDGNFNVLPLMTVEEYVHLFLQTSTSFPFFKIAAGNYEKIVIPITTGASLPLDDGYRYVISIANNTDTNVVEIHNLESDKNSGVPLRVQRLDVDGSRSEKLIQLKGIEYLFFPNGLPEKIEYQTPYLGGTRKVTLTKEQMELSLGVHHVVGLNGAAYVYSVGNLALNVSKIDALTVHTLGNGTDFTYYKLDLI